MFDDSSNHTGMQMIYLVNKLVLIVGLIDLDRPTNNTFTQDIDRAHLFELRM